MFNCTRLRFEQHKHGEKKNNYFTDLHFLIRSLLRQTKESENCWGGGNWYSGKPYTVNVRLTKFLYKPCDDFFHRFKRFSK